MRATKCFSVWKRFPSHVPRRQLSVMRPPGTFPATLTITVEPNGKSALDVDVSSSAHTLICHYSLRGICSACPLRVRRYTEMLEKERKKDSRLDSKDQKNAPVISSTDLIPRSRNLSDLESATGEYSNSVPRDPRRFAISLDTSTIAGLI